MISSALLPLLCLILCISSWPQAAAQLDCEGAAVEVVARWPGGSKAVFGYPALFGTTLNETATPEAPLRLAAPLDACAGVEPAAQPGLCALVQRGNCTFLEKAEAVQQAGYAYMLLFDSQPGCVVMSANASAGEGLNLTLAAASVSAEAGQLLQVAAAQGGNVTLRAPYLPRVDFASSAALWAMAVGTLVGGSLWSAAELRRQLAGRGTEQGRVAKGSGGSGGEVAVISTRGAVAFIFVASTMLLLLYWLINSWFVLLLVALFALGAWQTLSYLLAILLQRCSPPSWAAVHISLPWLGATHLLSLLASAGAAAVCTTWFVCRHARWAWVLQDVMGISLMLVILQQLRLPNLKVASILLPLAFLYDVWWVFIQPLFTGGSSVMIVVATGGEEQLPMLLEVPRRALGSNTAYSMLGFGDVVLPGLLAVFAARFDAATGLGLSRGFFVPVAVGYAVGLLLTWGALVFSIFGDQGQPALLYLVPCTLGVISLLAWWRGQFWELWGCTIEEREERGAAAAGVGPDGEGRLEEGGQGGSERRALLAGSADSAAA